MRRTWYSPERVELHGALVCLTDRTAFSLWRRRYAFAGWQRTDFGRAHTIMRLRAAQPIATSVCRAPNERARGRGTMIDLYRPIAVSTSDRLR